MKSKLSKRILSLFLTLALIVAGLTISSGGAAAAEQAAELPEGTVDYTHGGTHLNQYASETAGGVYFLQQNTLTFYSLASGELQTAYTFPVADYHPDGRYYGGQSAVSSYIEDGVLYYMYNAYRNTYSEDEVIHVMKYDLDEGRLLEDMTFPGHIGRSVGADPAGRIYIGVNDYFSSAYSQDESNLEQYGVMVYDSTGAPVAQNLSENDGDIVYAFNGFKAGGGFYYTGYQNYRYWGYDHDMYTLYAGSLREGALTLQEQMLGYLCQMFYYQFQNGAQLLNGRYLATKDGSVWDTDSAFSDGAYESSLVVSRERDEEPEYDTYDLSAIGARMLMTGGEDLLAYTSGRNIIRYDWETGEQTARYVTAHFVFNLLEFGDKILAVEKEGEVYYLEVFSLSDFTPLTAAVVNLNETDAYKDHTEEELKRHWQAGRIDPDTPVFAEDPSIQSPYAEGRYTPEMTQSLLNYSNYLRWLGGLTPFTLASEEDVRKAARGAVVLAASGQFAHNPVKDDTLADMDEAFFQDGYDGTSSSNISSGYAAGWTAGYMANIRGFLDDTANVSSMALGHRFTFLQRAGTEIAYGTAGGAMCQTVKALNNQENVTGTVQGVENNDYAYCWPAPGAFPVEEFETGALWSINFNDDKVRFSNQPLTLTITDLDTGEQVVNLDKFGSSQYMGSGMGWFYGKCLYFSGPKATSYLGKNYKVELQNLETSDGLPMTITYTVNFVSAEGRPAFLPGDMDGSGEVTIQDVMEACKVLARQSAGKAPTEDEMLRGNLDGDDTFSIGDVMEICKILARKA